MAVSPARERTKNRPAGTESAGRFLFQIKLSDQAAVFSQYMKYL